jgi:Carboxypeptidase regulatory-like domain
MQKRKLALCAGTLILMLPALLFGQSERGTISGLVNDPSGAVVVNAKVTVTNTATNNVVVVNTTPSGDYTALSLQAGTYSVRIEAKLVASAR